MSTSVKKYEALFFDVDGTILDTSQGIFETFRHVFKEFNKNVDEKEFPSFIGPPVDTSLRRFLQSEEIAAAHELFRTLYRAQGAFKAKPYCGIEDVLKKAKQNGYRLYTATSKNEIITIDILDRFKLLNYFNAVYGADAKNGRVHKTDVFRYALDKSKEAPKTSLLIGDTLYDLEGAFALGTDFLAATYGFGKESDLEGAHVIGKVKTPKGILEYI
jgi:phosphoglycolate phosphatase